jgi:hypothetical protein
MVLCDGCQRLRSDLGHRTLDGFAFCFYCAQAWEAASVCAECAGPRPLHEGLVVNCSVYCASCADATLTELEYARDHSEGTHTGESESESEFSEGESADESEDNGASIA